MPGEVIFTPSEEDYVAANRAHFIRLIHSRRLGRMLLPVAGVLLLVGTAIFLLSRNVYETIGAMSVGLIVGLLFLPVCYALNYALITRRARRLYRQQKSLQQEYRYEWDDQEVKYAAPGGVGATAWRDFHRWSDNPQVFLFYLNDCLFHFLPRRALSEEQAQNLAATLRSSGLQRF